jgi:methionine--tRNA ligase beta chain
MIMSDSAAEQFVTFEEFSKIRLCVGRVINAEPIQGMKKVFKATIDLGIEQRELAVGGAQFYTPSEFVGRIVVVCTNLEPKKIGGMISRGMLLAADGPEGKPIFLAADAEAPLGSPIH